MTNRIHIQPDATGMHVGIALSRYHAWATDRLLDGAVERFKRLGGTEKNLFIAPAAGAWELTAIAQALIEQDDFDGVVALGVVIRGETPHFDYICSGVTQGLMDLAISYGVPVGFGILTCNTTNEVEARCGGEVGNKGKDAMQAVVESAMTIQAIKKQAAGN